MASPSCKTILLFKCSRPIVNQKSSRLSVGPIIHSSSWKERTDALCHGWNSVTERFVSYRFVSRGHSQDNCIGHLMNSLPGFSHWSWDTSAAVEEGFLGPEPPFNTLAWTQRSWRAASVNKRAEQYFTAELAYFSSDWLLLRKSVDFLFRAGVHPGRRSQELLMPGRQVEETEQFFPLCHTCQGSASMK